MKYITEHASDTIKNVNGLREVWELPALTCGFVQLRALKLLKYIKTIDRT